MLRAVFLCVYDKRSDLVYVTTYAFRLCVQIVLIPGERLVHMCGSEVQGGTSYCLHVGGRYFTYFNGTYQDVDSLVVRDAKDKDCGLSSAGQVPA